MQSRDKHNMNLTKAPKKNNKQGKLSRIKRAERRTVNLFLLPSALGMLAFYILPFFVIIYYSVINNPVKKNFVFLDNFVSLLKNSAFKQASVNTLRFSAVAVPLAVVLSLVLALALMRNIPWKSQLRTVFLSPMMVPVASVILIWQVIFHYNGTANEILSIFGAAPIDWLKSDFSQIVVILLFLWKNLGYNMILFMSALGAIPKDVLEVAELEGASSLQIFFKIKLRYLSSTMIFVTLMSVINSFKIFREVYLLTGSYPYDSLYMLQHFMNNVFKSLEYQKLSAAAIIMALAVSIIIAVLLFVDSRIEEDIEE